MPFYRMTETSVATNQYEIAVERRCDYLFISLEGGENSYEITRRYWDEIISLTSDRKYSRVLVERNIAQSLNTQDVFRVLTEVAFIARTGVKFAFYDCHFDAEKSEFEELVSGNRGLNIKYFDNLPSAEIWLTA